MFRRRSHTAGNRVHPAAAGTEDPPQVDEAAAPPALAEQHATPVYLGGVSVSVRVVQGGEAEAAKVAAEATVPPADGEASALRSKAEPLNHGTTESSELAIKAHGSSVGIGSWSASTNLRARRNSAFSIGGCQLA